MKNLSERSLLLVLAAVQCTHIMDFMIGMVMTGFFAAAPCVCRSAKT